MYVRDAVFPLGVFCLAAFLPLSALTLVFVVGGQAHFLMMYLYQFRAGRMKTPRYLFAIILSLCAASFYAISVGAIMPLLLLVTFFFSLHFAIDEFYLHDEQRSFGTIVTTVTFVFLYTAFALVVYFPSLYFLPLMAIALAVVGIVFRLVSSKRPSRTEYYLWYIELMVVVLAVVFHVPEQVLSLIILLHYINWGTGYALKVRGTAREGTYWVDTLITTGLSLGLFLVYSHFHTSILAYFFSLTYFYLWTLAHFIFASRFISGTKTALNIQ